MRLPLRQSERVSARVTGAPALSVVSTAAVGLVTALLLAAACGPDEQRGDDAPGADGEAASGDLLIIGTTADIDAINPIVTTTLTGQEVYGEVFWPLAQSNPDLLTFRPALADSWEFSPDSLSITFHLNPGAAWHDGRPLRAEDVVFTIGLCKDERAAYSAIRWLDYIESVTAVDSLTIRFDYAKRYPYQLMDAVVCRPVPKHLLEDIPPDQLRNAEFNRQPVGSGPFKFKSWRPQQSVEVVANEAFFKGRPYLNGVVWRIIPDWSPLITQLVNGDIDLVTGIQPQYYEQLRADADLELYSAPGRRFVYLAWNTRDPLFADRDVRRALTMAVDREAIIDALLYGQGEVMAGPLVSILWAYDSGIEPLPHDVQRARQLLAQAGWQDTNGDQILDKDGRPFRFELVTNADNTMRMDMAVAIQSQLKRLGVDVRPRGLEFTLLVERLQGRNFQAAIGGWNSAVKVDLTDLWHSRSIEDKFNYVSYANPAVDSLIDAAVDEFDTARAKRLYSRAQQIIAEDAAYTFLFQQNDIHALHERFQNVQMNAYGWDYNLHEWYVPKGRQKY